MKLLDTQMVVCFRGCGLKIRECQNPLVRVSFCGVLGDRPDELKGIERQKHRINVGIDKQTLKGLNVNKINCFLD